MRPLKLIFSIGIMVAILLVIKIAVHYLGLEIISLTGLVTALIGGVTFTISILVAGTMPDYKESERIPGELSASLKSIFKDASLMSKDKKTVRKLQLRTKEILDAIVDNFRAGTWKQRQINEKIDALDEDLVFYSHSGAQAGYISRIRNEITNIERLSNRVETIKETNFLPAAGIISKFVVILVFGLLILVKVEPFYESIAILIILGYLLLGLIFLMKDMDDPFETGENSFADVDLEHIFKAQKYFDEQMKK